MKSGTTSYPARPHPTLPYPPVSHPTLLCLTLLYPTLHVQRWRGWEVSHACYTTTLHPWHTYTNTHLHAHKVSHVCTSQTIHLYFTRLFFTYIPLIYHLHLYFTATSHAHISGSHTFHVHAYILTEMSHSFTFTQIIPHSFTFTLSLSLHSDLIDERRATGGGKNPLYYTNHCTNTPLYCKEKKKPHNNPNNLNNHITTLITLITLRDLIHTRRATEETNKPLHYYALLAQISRTLSQRYDR
jgi:hypothetical protein